jgi:hypothetical protein
LVTSQTASADKAEVRIPECPFARKPSTTDNYTAKMNPAYANPMRHRFITSDYIVRTSFLSSLSCEKWRAVQYATEQWKEAWDKGALSAANVRANFGLEASEKAVEKLDGFIKDFWSPESRIAGNIINQRFQAMVEFGVDKVGAILATMIELRDGFRSLLQHDDAKRAAWENEHPIQAEQEKVLTGLEKRIYTLFMKSIRGGLKGQDWPDYQKVLLELESWVHENDVIAGAVKKSNLVKTLWRVNYTLESMDRGGFDPEEVDAEIAQSVWGITRRVKRGLERLSIDSPSDVKAGDDKVSCYHACLRTTVSYELGVEFYLWLLTGLESTRILSTKILRTFNPQ